MTDQLVADPLSKGGIAAFGKRLRSGETTIEDLVSIYLARIAVLEPRIGALEFVAEEQALAEARALDADLARGRDRGPLMGVPVLLKDLFAVERMPITCGSRIDVAEYAGSEGSFVKRLRSAGCVILGKCKTAEFARGGSGISRARGTPWNPWDSRMHRAPGGSSSGSAAAMAAGMAGFTIGTDTGGSVRAPAALCGVFGQKTTFGLWPMDGVYPNAHSFDTIGPLCRSAADGALIFATLAGQSVPTPLTLKGMRFGRPTDHFFDNLAPEVANAVEKALEAIARDGAQIVPVEVPEAGERADFVDILCGPEFIANLGRKRFEADLARLDPLTVARAARALTVHATEYVRMQLRQREVQRIYAARLAEVDAWLTPTVQVTAPEVIPAMKDVEATVAVEALLGMNTHLVSYFGLCAVSTPLRVNSALPVGLQTICGPGADVKALAIALRLENILGEPRSADLTGFVS